MFVLLSTNDDSVLPIIFATSELEYRHEQHVLVQYVSTTHHDDYDTRRKRATSYADD